MNDHVCNTDGPVPVGASKGTCTICAQLENVAPSASIGGKVIPEGSGTFTPSRVIYADDVEEE